MAAPSSVLRKRLESWGLTTPGPQTILKPKVRAIAAEPAGRYARSCNRYAEEVPT